MNLDSVKKAYFIGIGGIGMSALAQLLKERNIEVIGSDASDSPVTDKLSQVGIKVFFEQKAENITNDIDLVVYTIAIPESNPELSVARQKKIETKTYPEMLGVVSEGYFTIAISGTHGKTTTAAMTADVLVDGGLAPTAIVGSLVTRYKNNFIPGDNKYFLVESCEYKRSFLHIKPNILAITNIEEDHLDYYKDLSDIQSAFHNLALKVPKDGYIVCDPKDPTVATVIGGVEATIVDYTLTPNLSLTVHGKYNVENSKVAYTIGELLGVGIKDIENSLVKFSGTWRRFEYKGETSAGALVFDDYAHHPSEIRATLEMFAESFPNKKRIVVFQPHLFSRTKSLLSEFAKSFGRADTVIIVPIYAAREKDDGSVTHEVLAEAVRGTNSDVRVVGSLESAGNLLKGVAGSDGAIVTMGAGNVYLVGEALINK